LSRAGAPAQASLLSRAASTPGGIDYQAYYDGVLGSTWLADANYAARQGDPNALWNGEPLDGRLLDAGATSPRF